MAELYTDRTVDWLTLCSIMNRGPDHSPHHFMWSRCTNRMGLLQVFTNDRTRIVATATFLLPGYTKREFCRINWDELFDSTYHNLIDRFAAIPVDA